MRIGGLVSGIDTDSMLKEMMKAERIPVDRMKQKQQILEWQRDDYRAINTTLLNFSQKLFDMRLTSYYRGRVATVSNENLVTAVAGNGAGMSSYTISEVKQLATSSQRISKDGVSLETINVNRSLYEIKDQFTNKDAFEWGTGVIESKSFNGGSNTYELGVEIKDITNTSVKVNGKTYEVVTSNDNIQAGQVYISESGTLQFSEELSGNSKVKVDFIAKNKTVERNIAEGTKTISLGKGSIVAESVEITIGEDTFKVNENNELVSGEKVLGKINLSNGTITINPEWSEIQDWGDEEEKKTIEIEATFSQNYFSFGINADTTSGPANEKFLIAGNESLSNVISKVNQSNVGVTMFYDSHTNKMVMTKRETGNLNIDVTGGFMENVLSLGDDNSEFKEGQNAIFVVNGLETERTSNTFTMNNVTFTLNKAFGKEESVQVNVNSDNEKVFDNIVKFVDEYNKVVDEIQNKINEQRYKDYHPLTEEERLQLSDRHEEMWEEKARSGLLRRDPMLSSALSEMRTSIYSPVNNPEMDGLINQLSQIGITTTANYNDGKLVIDEDKLRKAIEEDPNSVEKVFIGTGDSFGEKGVIQRLTDNVNNTREKLRQKAGSASSVNHQFSIGKEIDSLNKQIERFEERLRKVEDRYWRQFSAMEAAVQRANMQMAQLMSALGGGEF